MENSNTYFLIKNFTFFRCIQVRFTACHGMQESVHCAISPRVPLNETPGPGLKGSVYDLFGCVAGASLGKH